MKARRKTCNAVTVIEKLRNFLQVSFYHIPIVAYVFGLSTCNIHFEDLEVDGRIILQ